MKAYKQCLARPAPCPDSTVSAAHEFGHLSFQSAPVCGSIEGDSVALVEWNVKADCDPRVIRVTVSAVIKEGNGSG